MAEVRQKNLKLSEEGIEILRSLAFFSKSTEADAVEQAMVSSLAQMAVQSLRKANATNSKADDNADLITAKFMVNTLETYDSDYYWKVERNCESGLWELLRSPVDPTPEESDLVRQTRIKEMIIAGKRRGLLTYGEVADALTGLEFSADQMDEIYEALAEAGIDLVSDDSDHAPQKWDGKAWLPWPWAGATSSGLDLTDKDGEETPWVDDD